MRVNLNVSYEDRHAAKALGAWWDSRLQCWYVVDPKDLVPFTRWLRPKAEPVVRTVRPKKQKKPKKSKNTNWLGSSPLPEWERAPPDLLAMWREKLPYNPKSTITGPAIGPADCGCPTPPWEPCEHTSAWLARTVGHWAAQGQDIRG